MKEPTLLLAVQGQIRGVARQHNLRRRILLRLNEYFHQPLVPRVFPEPDLFIAVFHPSPQFHPLPGAFAGQRRFQFLSSCQNTQPGIPAQLLVIVEIFLPQRQSIDALRELSCIVCSTGSWFRPSSKQPARRGSKFRRLSLCRSRIAPPSELIVPPSNRATISRLPDPSNSKLDWLHSVLAKAVLSLALTVVWKLSYARKGGLLPIASVESRPGASTDAEAPPRFPAPLIKPDVPVSGIRLSD